MFGPTTPVYPGFVWQLDTAQNSHRCPESSPTKNSVRKGPSRRDRPGISWGTTSSIFTIGKDAALLLISNAPASPGPSQTLCVPKEIWTLLMLTEAMLSSSLNWFAVDVPFGSGGVRSAAAVAARVDDDSDGMAGA